MTHLASIASMYRKSGDDRGLHQDFWLPSAERPPAQRQLPSCNAAVLYTL